MLIMDLLIHFKEYLNPAEYNLISRINIVQSSDPLVKNLGLLFSFREALIEIREVQIGGLKIDLGYLAKSLILDKLIEGQAVTLVLRDGHQINAGIKRIESNFNLVYYTGKGLREIWGTDASPEETRTLRLKEAPEEELIKQNYIAITNMDLIYKII